MNPPAAVITTIVSFLILTAAADDCPAQNRRTVVLEGKRGAVTVDLGGGGISSFVLAGGTLNPLQWRTPEPGDTEPHSMGHFICFDRLGRSTKAEQANGMPGHGEAAEVEWRLDQPPGASDGAITAGMSCTLPIAGMSLHRSMVLAADAPVLHVTETARNDNRLGRVYNLVQHPSLGGPFLDGGLIIDSNAGAGFWAGNPFPELAEPVISWPRFTFGGRMVDIRRVEAEQEPAVVNFIFDDGAGHGWVTASNPPKGLMIGYIWRTADYPWFRVWRRNGNGGPVARGIEFGTTPLPLPFEQVIATREIFGRAVYDWLDAGGEKTRSYTAFLLEIPGDYRGTEEVAIEDGVIVVREYGGEPGRSLIAGKIPHVD